MIIKTGLISRVAFSIAGIDIYWYAILIVSAIVIGIIWSRIKSGRYKTPRSEFSLCLEC